MSQGVAGVLTLYDDLGNPVQVVLQDGTYRLAASDERTHAALDEIRLLLTEILQVI